MSDNKSHDLAFIRRRGLGELSNLWVVRITLTDPESDKDDALRALKAAVTDWVVETKEGDAAWEQSCEDFNIGDFFCYVTTNLREFLARHGVADIELRYQLGEGEDVSFDELLVDASRLPEDQDEEPTTTL
jgi:hypothetical protein